MLSRFMLPWLPGSLAIEVPRLDAKPIRHFRMEVDILCSMKNVIL